MASIQTISNKSGKSYRVQFMKNSKRLSKRFAKKKDAEKFLALLTLDDQLTDRLTNKTQSTLMFSDACEEYLKQYTGKCPSTVQRVNWWANEYQTLKLNAISKQCVRSSLKNLANDKSAATVNRYKAALSAVFTYLQDEYDVSTNPAREVKQLPENNERIRFLTDNERHSLLQAVKKSTWNKLYLLVILALTTGARRGDLLNLKWSDIDFKARTASISTTKNGEPRVLPLTEEAISELMKFRCVGATYIFAHPTKIDENFYNFDCHWHKALNEAKLINFRFHDLRHTAGSMLAMANVQTAQIADILGHKTLNVTKRYIHLSTAYKADVINDVMGGIAYE